LINNTNITNSYCGISGSLISCCGCKVDCWKEEGLCSLLEFVKPIAIVVFTLSCCSIGGALFIISSWGFIGLRTESRKFFIMLSVVNMVTSLASLPLLSTILFPANIQWLRNAPHMMQVLMILNQYFATCSFVWTTIVNLHLYCFVKYGREGLKWNKYFHIIVWVIAAPSTIPIIVGIYLNTHFPIFAPSPDLQIVIKMNSFSEITLEPTITFNKFVDDLHNVTLILQLLTFGAILLWLTNILSSILIKIALNKFFKLHYLQDDNFKKEFGIDTSLTTVSHLLIIAQIPGLVFACWFFFSKQTIEWQNPIIFQSAFTLGASIQGLMNSIYYVAKRELRLRVWVLIKNLASVSANPNEETRTLIVANKSTVQ